LKQSLLISGPPATGKTRAALERFLTFPDSTLLTPTTTMAEHVRNELARTGVAVRPSRVLTLAQFVDRATELAPAPEAVLHLLIEQALERLRPSRLNAVAQFRGFFHALASLMEESPVDALSGPFAGDLARVFREVEAGLAVRGMALRNPRLRSLRRTPAEHVVLDGFFSFSPAELDLIEALAAQSTVTVTLPDWPGASPPRRRLLAAGFPEQRFTRIRRAPRRSAFSASTLERETEEIARRILEQAERGRRFRDIGIVLRTRDPYGPALETALARFGIPARFYFADPLDAHPAVQYLSGIVRLMLEGWDHAAVLSLLRMAVSGIGATPAGDALDFALREKLPGTGLPLPAGVPESFAALDAWRRERLEPPEWAARLKTLRTLLPQPVIEDRVSREQVQIWRAKTAALEAFDSSLDSTAVALAGAGRIGMAEFWRQAAIALALEPLRVPDRRRDVVHVLDVFEARQWELPIVFVCGLVERHFPQYHRQDPLLDDAARRRAGLRTSADRQLEERFLFEMATTRAVDETILSYARFNEKGEEALPSFFLEGTEAPRCEVRIRPKPLRSAAVPAPAAIQDLVLRERLAQVHTTLAPTSIESFLQCPFQFFAAKTLRLRRRPPEPRDRLDLLAQGSILHLALAELARFPLLGAAVFDNVFVEEIRRRHIPATYRTEAVRLELLRHFQGFLADRRIMLGWPSRVEEQFQFALNPLVRIAGRIDRLDVGPKNQALVIDYKYSAGNKIRERIEENAAGNLVQGGLYLLAAERQFGLEPAGMLYCGLRKEVAWDGWHLPVAGLEHVGESMTRSALREMMDAAARTATEAFAAIASGRIAAEPKDRDKCKWCDFRDICRVEAAAIVRRAGSA